jgi:hypothetical protein
VPEVVEPDALHADSRGEPLEPARQGVGIEVLAVAAIHHEVAVVPPGPEQHPALVLFLPVPPEVTLVFEAPNGPFNILVLSNTFDGTPFASWS